MSEPPAGNGSAPTRPRLSVVATSRNDDHGGHLIERMQWFIDGLAWHAGTSGCGVELIMVEWNPPSDRPSLADALVWPSSADGLRTRILTVPQEVHERIVGPDGIPMMQMLAKNVGIRRASAELVLATNIDVLLAPELFAQSLALETGSMLRADRDDVTFPFSHVGNVEGALRFCETNILRCNRRDGIYTSAGGRSLPIYQSVADAVTTAIRRTESRVAGGRTAESGAIWATASRSATSPRRASLKGVAHLAAGKVRALQALAILPKLHTNACGDFTLLTAGDWRILRGYPEWPVHSWYLDSILLHQARAAGLRFVEAAPPAVAYHMDHSVGSGWSPSDHGNFLAGLARGSMPYISAAEFHRLAMKLARCRAGAPPTFNDENWGLIDDEITEVVPSSA